MAAFAQQVTTFIAQHWPAAASATHPGDVKAWRQALVEKGWSVPAWPVQAGGTGWNPTQHYLWRAQCAAALTPELEDVGVDVVGPLILASGDLQIQQQHLPDIVALRAQWCIGFFEPDAASDINQMTCAITPKGDEFVLQGCKCFVAYGSSARWMCCFARVAGTSSYALYIVDLHADGVAVTPTTMWDGSQDMASVLFDDVVLPQSAQLTEPDDGAVWSQQLFTQQFSTLSRSALASAQLAVLDKVLLALDDEDLKTKRDALAVDLAGLQAMELRYVDALQRGVQPPYSLVILQAKSRQILLQLGALQIESFGYYALPYPDEKLLHNEGPIAKGPGNEIAGATIRQTLTQQLTAIYEGSAEQLKDEAWRHLSHKT